MGEMNHQPGQPPVGVPPPMGMQPMMNAPVGAGAMHQPYEQFNQLNYCVHSNPSWGTESNPGSPLNSSARFLLLSFAFACTLQFDCAHTGPSSSLISSTAYYLQIQASLILVCRWFLSFFCSRPIISQISVWLRSVMLCVVKSPYIIDFVDVLILLNLPLTEKLWRL